MAVRILGSRLAQPSVPLRVCVTSNASMSSSSPASSSSSSTPASQPKAGPGNPVPKRESIRSILASAFGGKVEPADPNDEPIDAKDIRLPHSVDHATGERKLFLLAFENGFLDPYSNLPVERNGRGTKDNPVPIEAFGNERIVACSCETTQNHLKYTWVYRGEPKRCQCGHWLKLVDAPRFWEKIPKEDLLEIPYFADLEEKGKLDLLLAGKWPEEDEHKQLGGHGGGHH